METWVIILVNAVVLLSSLWAVSIRMTWKAASTKAEIIKAITDHEKVDEAEIATVRKEIYTTTNNFGETIMSLKQHINNIQLEASQLYVRRDGFYHTQQELKESIKSLSEAISARLDRMESKIDSKT